MKRLLITGANGQLGSEIKVIEDKFEGYELLFTDAAELDITDSNSVKTFIALHKPVGIINCAAYTAVDKAETDAETAHLVNAKAPEILAKEAEAIGAFIIQVSTDYVFKGESYLPYTEDDKPNPLSVYGVSKLQGEQNIRENCTKHIIIRTAWLYSSFGNNFVKTMLRLGTERDSLGVIFDQAGTPTYAADLAEAIATVVAQQDSNPKYGVYHFSNEGICSWYDFAVAIFKLKGIACSVNPIETTQYPTPAKRPQYSVFNKKKIKADYGISIPHWEESLKVCLEKL